MKNLKYVSKRMMGAAFVGLALLSTPAISLAEKVRAENFTEYTDIEEQLGSALNAELKSAIKKQGLAVFITNLSFPRKQACYAFAGVTTPAQEGRNPRIPSKRFSTFYSMEAESWDESECLRDVTRSAMENLGKAPVNDVLKNITSTVNAGAPFKNEPENRRKVSVGSIGLSDDGKSAVFKRMHEANVSDHVDYRHVEAAVFTDVVKLSNGLLMCVSVAGLTGRPSKEMNMRWPANMVALSRLQEGGTPQGCVDFIAENSVELLLKQGWTNAGLLKGFNLVREDGVPMPTVASVQKRLDASVKTQRSLTKAQNSLTCHNQCVNGDCLRTFPNGRKERWQAPRVYNPLNNNWEWDTSTNACGL